MHKPGEINEQDLIFTTVLRMNFPDTFSLIHHSKDLLCSPKPQKTKDGWRRENSQEADSEYEQNSEWQQRIDTIRSSPNSEAGTIILEHLFPVLRNPHPENPKPGRISHPAYFFRYFAQAIPEGDISDIELRNILENASSGKDSSALSTLFSREELDLDLLMGKLIHLYPWPNSASSSSTIIGPASTNLLAQSLQLLSDQSDNPLRKDIGIEINPHMGFSAHILTRLAYNGESVESIESTLKSADLSSEIEAKLLVKANGKSRGDDSPRFSTLSTIENNLVHRNLNSIEQRFLRRDDSSSLVDIYHLFLLLNESAARPVLVERLQRHLKEKRLTTIDLLATLLSLRDINRYLAQEFFTSVTGISIGDPTIGKGWDKLDTWEGRQNAARALLAKNSPGEQPQETDV